VSICYYTIENEHSRLRTLYHTTMPRKTFQRRRSSRRLTRRKSRVFKRRTNKRYGRRRTAKVPLMWSDKKRIHLRYIDDSNASLVLTGVTGFEAFQMRLNGAFDVNPSLGNVAMPGFEPYTTMYNRFRVVTAKITVRFDNTNTVPVRVGIGASTPSQTTEIGTLDRSECLAWQGNKNVKWKTLNSYGSGTSNSCTLSKTWRLSKLFTQPLEYFADPSWTGTTTANPSKTLVGWIWAFTHAGTAGSASVSYSWTVDMWIDLFDPRKDFP